jgi:hypothetical protein
MSTLRAGPFLHQLSHIKGSPGLSRESVRKEDDHAE